MTVAITAPMVDDGGATVARSSAMVTIRREALPDEVFLDMVFLPEGTCAMGSAPHRGRPDEEPVHYVHVHDFLMSQMTVTQRQWKAVMGRLPPCRGKSPEHPVDRVSWQDAQRFCERLSEITGKPYRLPSESEWEYACRGGNVAEFAHGGMITTEPANYVGLHRYLSGPAGTYRHGPLPVGQFPPNRFGLYDMHGNLWEWCADRWHKNYAGAPLDETPWVRGGTDERVLRGGSWHDPPELCRSRARLKLLPTEGEDFVGIRLALTLCPEG